MPTLVAGIHDFTFSDQFVDARHEAGHDDESAFGLLCSHDGGDACAHPG
jgi:hypothetical protein